MFTHTDRHTTILLPFFQDHPGEPLPEENFWTSWCKGRLTEADTPTIRLGATPSGLTSAHLHHPQHFLQTGCPSCRCQSTESNSHRQTCTNKHSGYLLVTTKTCFIRSRSGLKKTFVFRNLSKMLGVIDRHITLFTIALTHSVTF